VKVTMLETRGPSSPPPALTPQVLGPVEKLAVRFWPGFPVSPILQPGATDGEFTNAAGIPTYGIDPVFAGPDLGHIHGLNEYVGVKSLLEARDFLYQLVKVYADQKLHAKNAAGQHGTVMVRGQNFRRSICISETACAPRDLRAA
jgi:acetylornithine deacetylase/succinyl-diaminopimelate desuccinylase-like protein